MSQEPIEIFTDGACSGNPGPGGWGAILRFRGVEKEMYGGTPQTTNNRMEMTAVIEALNALKRPCSVHLHTDSQYVLKGMTEWLPEWKARGWKTSGKKNVKNEDLWRALDEAANRHALTWTWVKGHAGHPENERADVLARQGTEEARAEQKSANNCG